MLVMAGGTLPERQILHELLSRIRLDADRRQVDLAEGPVKLQSYVSKYESGEKIFDIDEVKKSVMCSELNYLLFARKLVNRSKNSGLKQNLF